MVLARRLWPRALLTPFTDVVDLTHADRKAYTSYARAQRHKGFEEVTVSFDKPGHGRAGSRDRRSRPEPEQPSRSRSGADVQVGMTLPVMEPDLDAEVLETWSRTVDDGPFSSLCFGERMAFDNPETMTLLGAVSAWTSRVRLVTTVVVPQLHEPVLLAKSLATADLLSGGRLTVGRGRGRSRGGLPGGGRRPRDADHGGDGRAGRARCAASGGASRSSDDVRSGRPAARAARRPDGPGRHDGPAHRPARGGLGRRPGRRHPRPRPGAGG